MKNDGFGLAYTRELMTDTSWLGVDSRHGKFLIGDAASGMVKPGDVVSIIARTYIPFRGERLCVWSGCAESFIIHTVMVGTAVRLAAAAPIPADAFMARMDALAMMDELVVNEKGAIIVKVGKRGNEMGMPGAPMTLPIALPGMDICLHVENVGTEPKRFLAGFMGKIPRDY